MSEQAQQTQAPGVPDAPPVVAVVVTCNPGAWLEESLEALGNQDYPNLAVLVVDAASTDDPLQRIAAALPGAFVRRLSRNPGYAAAANRSLRIVQGATYLLMCHDDVAPAPDAVGRMVAQAMRENAAVVTPKFVAWNDSRSLLALGGTTDGTCAFIPAVDRGDTDQGQVDVAKETFVATGGFMLVRSELFSSLNGFDAAMTRFGEDVDFSWRAQLAGARIVTAPDARVRHLEALSNGMRFLPHSDDAEAIELEDDTLRRRHRLRTALKVKRGPRMLAMALRLAILNVAEVVYCLFTGKPGHAGAVASAWGWNVLHWRGLSKARRQVWKSRTVSDKVIGHRLGSARRRIEAVVRREWELRAERIRAEGFDGRDVVGILRNLTFATAATIAVIWGLGSRDILREGLPSLGRMSQVDASGLDSLRHFFGLLPSDGFGAAVATSPGYLWSALIGLLSPGSTTLVQTVFTLALLPLGLWGVARMVRPLESSRARLAALAAYAAVPLPYSALGLGRVDSLIAYAVAPWVMLLLLRGEGDRPFGALGLRRSLHVHFRRRHDDDEELESLDVSSLSESGRASQMLGLDSAAAKEEATSNTLRDRISFLLLRRVAPLALVSLTAGAFTPQFVPAVAVTGLLIVAGSVIAGRSEDGSTSRLDALFMSLLAPLVALFVLAPSLVAGANGIGDVLRIPWTANPSDDLVDMFLLSPGTNSSWFTAGLLIAGLPALFLGSGWRFRLAVKMWFVVAGTAMFCWAGRQGWLGDTMPDPRIYLAFAAAAMVANIAVGVQALSLDLRRYAFGWRQAMPVFAIVGIAVALVPIAMRAGNGSWNTPSIAAPQVLSWMNSKAEEGAFRTLWLGNSNGLPGVARMTGDDIASAVTVNSPVPEAGMVPAATGKEGEVAIAKAIEAARSADTVTLGRALAPYGVRYVVVPERTGVSGGTSLPAPPPPGLVEAMSNQLDLVSIDSDSSLHVYENREWLSVRSQLSPEATLLARNFTGPQQDATSDLGDSRPVLVEGRKTWSGPLDAGEVYLSEARSEGWKLVVDGKQVPDRDAFGWASSFEVANAGDARLTYTAPVAVPITQTAVVLVWLGLFVLSVRFRARKARS